MYANAHNANDALGTYMTNNSKGLVNLQDFYPQDLNQLHTAATNIHNSLPNLKVNVAGVDILPDDAQTRSILSYIAKSSTIILYYFQQRLSGGAAGVDQLNQAVYRIAFSDHVPIQLIIH